MTGLQKVLETYTCRAEKSKKTAYGHRESYQTCAKSEIKFEVPQATTPTSVQVDVKVPVSIPECQTLPAVEIMETKCEEVRRKKCISVPKFDTVDRQIYQSKTGLADEGVCKHITLSLPTKLCKKSYH